MSFTLARYFFRRHIAIMTWFLIGIGTLVYIIDFTELSRRLGDIPGFTSTLGLQISALRVPTVLLQVIPFIALFGGMATLISLNRRYELVVARAAGVSAWQFLRPICLGALLFGILSVGLLNPLAAFGFVKAQSLEAELVSRDVGAAQAQRTPWIRQRAADRDTVIGAVEVTDGGSTLVLPVFLGIDDNGSIVERLDAEKATLHDGYWELSNVRRHVESAAAAFEATVTVPTNLRPEIVQEKLSPPETVPFFDLPSKIETARSFGLKASAFAMQFHTLIALPFLLVGMTLVAGTVSISFTRTGQSATLVFGGVVAGFLLYVISVLVKAFGTAGFVPPVVAAWVPVFMAMVFGVTFLLHREDG